MLRTNWLTLVAAPFIVTRAALTAWTTPCHAIAVDGGDIHRPMPSGYKGA